MSHFFPTFAPRKGTNYKTNYAKSTIHEKTLPNIIINRIPVLCRPYNVGTDFSLPEPSAERPGAR
jgi:hypothetical protein